MRAALVVVLVLAAAGCRGDSIERGNALAEQDGAFAGFSQPFGADQEFHLAMMSLENVGTRELTVRRVEPLLGDGSEDVADVVRALLSTSKEGGLRRSVSRPIHQRSTSASTRVGVGRDA